MIINSFVFMVDLEGRTTYSFIYLLVLVDEKTLSFISNGNTCTYIYIYINVLYRSSCKQVDIERKKEKEERSACAYVQLIL